MAWPVYDITAELSVQREVTLAFIYADPISVVLIPRVRTVVDGAAQFGDGPPRAAQTFKLIMQSPAGGSIEQHTSSGTERKIDFTLLGAWDSIADIGDHWTDGNGQHWEITAIVPDNGYERRYITESYGPDAVGG